ncbi:MAG: hypothetical protein HDS12_04625 [Bacteroides sp.]|nr:hypothetical protein [Bacteroides sp.]
MKLFAWIILLIPMFIGGCFREEDLGYPKKVFFTPEGGTQIIEGNTRIMPEIEVGHDAVGAYYQDDDSICVKYEWLHVNASTTEPKITLTVPPSDVKKRKLKIRGTSAMEYCEIMVYQQ